MCNSMFLNELLRQGSRGHSHHWCHVSQSVIAVLIAVPDGQVLWFPCCSLRLWLRAAHCVLRVHRLVAARGPAYNSEKAQGNLYATWPAHPPLLAQAKNSQWSCSGRNPTLSLDALSQEEEEQCWRHTCVVPGSQIQRRQQRQNTPFKSTTFPVLAPRTDLDLVKRTHLTPQCPLELFLSLNLHMICVYKISDRQSNKYMKICITCVCKPLVCSDVHENPFRYIFSESSQNIDLTSVANASLV